jgi:hypothetical protein
MDTLYITANPAVPSTPPINQVFMTTQNNNTTDPISMATTRYFYGLPNGTSLAFV